MSLPDRISDHEIAAQASDRRLGEKSRPISSESDSAALAPLHVFMTYDQRSRAVRPVVTDIAPSGDTGKDQVGHLHDRSRNSRSLSEEGARRAGQDRFE